MANTKEMLNSMIEALIEEGKTDEEIRTILVEKASNLRSQGWKEAALAAAITAVIAVGGYFVIRKVRANLKAKKEAAQAEKTTETPAPAPENTETK